MVSLPTVATSPPEMPNPGKLGESKAELRTRLLDEFDQCFGIQGARPSIVEAEVDHFLLNGRVSHSNLNRLQRRIQSKLGDGGRSESSYSARTERSQRSPSCLPDCASSCAPNAIRRGESICDAMPRVAEELEDDVLRWSHLAKLATKEAELEEERKREARRAAQEEMRAFLKEQVDQKQLRLKKAAEDEIEFFRLQQADLECWKQDQIKQAEERVRKMQQEVLDRNMQSEQALRAREAERQRRSSEDRRLILRAAKESELEKQAVEEKRRAFRKAQFAVAQRNSKNGADARQKRIEEERQTLQEYSRLLERQEARSKASKPRIRDQTPVAPQKAMRKGEEIYYDPDTVMKIQNEAAARAEQAELSKQERLKAEKQMHQAYLFQQIAEREAKRRRFIEEEKGGLKAAEAAAKEHEVAEQQRLQAQKLKSMEYRLELDRQIQLKKAVQQLKEDQMSGAEKAMNRRFVMEAMQKTSPPPSSTRCP